MVKIAIVLTSVRTTYQCHNYQMILNFLRKIEIYIKSIPGSSLSIPPRIPSTAASPMIDTTYY